MFFFFANFSLDFIRDYNLLNAIIVLFLLYFVTAFFYMFFLKYRPTEEPPSPGGFSLAIKKERAEALPL